MCGKFLKRWGQKRTHEGLIESLDDPVVQTVSRLRGSAYDGVRDRDVLQMSTGVGWVETYLDPESDRRKLMALQVQERSGLVLDYLARLPRVAEPGTRFNYNTAETFPARRHPRRRHPLPALARSLREDLEPVCGMESDAYWQLESASSQGVPAGAHALRDYGRFGLFVLADGVVAEAGACCQRPGWPSPRQSCPARRSRRPEDCPGTNCGATATSGGRSRSSRQASVRCARHLRPADLCRRRRGCRHRRARRVAATRARPQPTGELHLLRNGDGDAENALRLPRKLTSTGSST